MSVGKFQPTLPARGATRRLFPRFADIEFQPTLPARGATAQVATGEFDFAISTHAPREGSDFWCPMRLCPKTISTHAPREGSDPAPPWAGRCRCRFQPTLPARGATGHALPPIRSSGISTHAPREGSDTLFLSCVSSRLISTHAPREGSDHSRSIPPTPHLHFNPRSPRGERHFHASSVV